MIKILYTTTIYTLGENIFRCIRLCGYKILTGINRVHGNRSRLYGYIVAQVFFQNGKNDLGIGRVIRVISSR